MRTASRLLTILLATFLTAPQVLAEQHDEYLYILGSYLEPDSDLTSDDGYGVQIGAGWALHPYWNLEAFMQRSETGDGPEFRHSTLGFDLQLLFNREGRFSPYLFAGAGHMAVSSEIAERDRGGVVHGGAGFRANIFGASRASLRGEYRLRDYDYLGTGLDDNLISLGIQFPFGDQAPVVTDTDNDRVADGMDRCPNTPAGTQVDSYGCETDSDGDGVADSLDQCANTPRGTSVDVNGCAIDGDGDGVPDDLDECPGTYRGAAVDSRGCELDGDADGVVDRLDECPDSAANVQVDIAGCEIREEISLPGVNFESNSDRLLGGTDAVLNAAAATLQKNPEISVEVAGHTDSDGAAEYNLSLSERRAQTVRDYLIRQGVAAERFSVRGYGESQPVADNGNAAGKAANRRVVLRITDR